MKKILVLLLVAMTWINADVVMLSNDNYEQEIKKHDKAVIMFSASWCGACKMMKPIYKAFASKSGETTFMGSIDVDASRKLAALYRIESLPTLILLENGKEIKRTVGVLNPEELDIFVHTEKAITAYSKICDEGDSGMCLNIGELYEEGKLVKRDYTKAVSFYRKSCGFKNAEGCMYLGYMYDEALGVKQDYKMAFNYYKQGCDGQNIISCRFLGYMYAEGLGTEKDYKKAYDLYKQSCEHEDEYACNNLAYMYEKGTAVAKDLGQAIEFYTHACALGHQPACKRVEKLKENK